MHVGRLAYPPVEQSAGRQVFGPSEKSLRTMAIFKIPLYDAGTQYSVHAASTEKEVPVGTDYQRPLERAVGEDTQAVVGAVLQHRFGIG